MKSRFIQIICLFICAGLAACCTAPTGKSTDSAATSQKAYPSATPVFPELDSWLAENKLVINAGQSDVFEYDTAFAQGVVMVYGEGYPVAGADGIAQKRITAIRAAEVTAQRNLAEYFVRQATNGEIRFDNYHSNLEAFLKGAYVVVGEYNRELGKAAILLKLELRSAKGFAK